MGTAQLSLLEIQFSELPGIMHYLRATLLLASLFIATLHGLPQSGFVSEETCGIDSQTGQNRQPGDSWKEDCNRCQCLPGNKPGCTKILCENLAVSNNFEGGKGHESRNLCGLDERTGKQRRAGETWNVDCNTCFCRDTSTPPICTLALCSPKSSFSSSSGVQFPG